MNEDLLHLEELDSDVKLYLLQNVEFEQLVFLAHVAPVEYKEYTTATVCRATELVSLIRASMLESI